MKSSAAKKQADQQYSNDMATAKMQREWNIEDRDEARAYGIQELAEVREYSRNAYSHMVQDSEAAGINPLTALRNGGGAGYSAAYGQSPGFAPLSRTAPTRQAPAGLGAHVGDFLQNFDPFEDAARMQGAKLINAQVANLEANTAATLQQTARVELRPSGRAASLSNPKANNAANTAGRTLLDQSGATIPVGPGSSAEDWESEYGEIAGELEGLPRYLRDRVTPALTNPGTYGLEAWPSWQWPSMSKPSYLESIKPARRAKAPAKRPARPGQNIPLTYQRWNP